MIKTRGTSQPRLQAAFTGRSGLDVALTACFVCAAPVAGKSSRGALARSCRTPPKPRIIYAGGHVCAGLQVKAGCLSVLQVLCWLNGNSCQVR